MRKKHILQAFFRRRQVSVQSGFPAWSLKSVFFGVQTTPTNQTPYFSTQGLASCEKNLIWKRRPSRLSGVWSVLFFSIRFFWFFSSDMGRPNDFFFQVPVIVCCFSSDRAETAFVWKWPNRVIAKFSRRPNKSPKNSLIFGLIFPTTCHPKNSLRRIPVMNSLRRIPKNSLGRIPKK